MIARLWLVRRWAMWYGRRYSLREKWEMGDGHGTGTGTWTTAAGMAGLPTRLPRCIRIARRTFVYVIFRPVCFFFPLMVKAVSWPQKASERAI